jgi:hypothetical protein
MTIEEQLHTTARLLEATATVALRNEETCKRLFELAEVQSRSLGTLAEALDIGYHRLTECIAALTEQVTAYVAESRAYGQSRGPI